MGDRGTVAVERAAEHTTSCTRSTPPGRSAAKERRSSSPHCASSQSCSTDESRCASWPAGHAPKRSSATARTRPATLGGT